MENNKVAIGDGQNPAFAFKFGVDDTRRAFALEDWIDAAVSVSLDCLWCSNEEILRQKGYLSGHAGGGARLAEVWSLG